MRCYEDALIKGLGITTANCRFYPSGYYIASQSLRGRVGKEKACFLGNNRGRDNGNRVGNPSPLPRIRAWSVLFLGQRIYNQNG